MKKEKTNWFLVAWIVVFLFMIFNGWFTRWGILMWESERGRVGHLIFLKPFWKSWGYAIQIEVVDLKEEFGTVIITNFIKL